MMELGHGRRRPSWRAWTAPTDVLLGDVVMPRLGGVPFGSEYLLSRVRAALDG